MNRRLYVGLTLAALGTETSDGAGGGLFVLFGTAELSGTHILNNTASLGGGVYAVHGTTTLAGAEMSGNSATGASPDGSGGADRFRRMRADLQPGGAAGELGSTFSPRRTWNCGHKGSRDAARARGTRSRTPLGENQAMHPYVILNCSMACAGHSLRKKHVGRRHSE